MADPSAADDGVIASCRANAAAISVADLGGDGVMDLFAGTHWVKFDPKQRSATVTNMLPAEAEINATQPTICDLDGDSKADSSSA